jgi:hypothetical protein
MLQNISSKLDMIAKVACGIAFNEAGKETSKPSTASKPAHIPSDEEYVSHGN